MYASKKINSWVHFNSFKKDTFKPTTYICLLATSHLKFKENDKQTPLLKMSFIKIDKWLFKHPIWEKRLLLEMIFKKYFLMTLKFLTKNNDKRKSSLILWTPISCPNSPFVLLPCLILMFSLHQKIATMTKAGIHRSTKEQKCKIKDH